MAAKAQGWAVDRALVGAAAWVADADEERVPEMGAVEVAAAEAAAAVAVRAGRNRSQPIRITIASGKGGTGKTTIAVNLAYVLAQQGEAVHLVDCDVEEPNAHIFLRPQLEGSRPVSIPTPEVDAALCTGCGECGKMCQYGAIVAVKKKVLTFPALCNGCGGCKLVCPEKAITEVPREIGVIEEGTAGRMRFTHGVLNVGEARATPVIRQMVEGVTGRTVIMDAPPGTSCPVIESVRTADFVLLVTEPTPFGLNDLELAVGMVRELGKPLAVVVNRADVGDSRVLEYCAAQNIPVPLQIPNSREAAEAYSRGELLAKALVGYRDLMASLYQHICEGFPE